MSRFQSKELDRLRRSVEKLSGGGVISDAPYSPTGWDGDTNAPSKNAVRDKLESLVIPAAANPTGTIGVAAVNGVAATFMRSDAAPAFDMTIARNWTAGVHTFTAQDVHNAGVSLGASGVLATVVTTGASAAGYDFQDGSRTSGYIRQMQRGGTYIERVSWDGRYAFGYSATLSPLVGHQLSFLADDSATPSGSPIYVGILGLVTHQNTSETFTRSIGVQGAAGTLTATGFASNLLHGVIGSIFCNANSSFAGKIAACFSGTLSQLSSISSIQSATKDITFTKSAHPAGAWDHLCVYWGTNFSSASSTGYPSSLPLVTSVLRAPIQDWGASISAGTPAGQYWALYGEHINGTVATYPAHTGYLRMTYPRRTGGTGVHAVHAWWEPWPNTTAIRGGGIDGDSYFDDGTNFRKGLWEYAGGWFKLMQLKQQDALGGGAAATLGTIGGTGPTAAAQNTWIQVVGTNGTAYWVPAWV